jgi:hypothetical protein
MIWKDADAKDQLMIIYPVMRNQNYKLLCFWKSLDLQWELWMKRLDLEENISRVMMIRKGSMSSLKTIKSVENPLL